MAPKGNRNSRTCGTDGGDLVIELWNVIFDPRPSRRREALTHRRTDRSTVAVASPAAPRIPGSFNHLIGSGEDRGRDCKGERVCGLEVDDKLEFGWLINRDVARF